MPATEVLVDGLDHPEGVAWDPATGVLWAGGEDGQLYRVDIEARTWEEAPRAPGFVLGLAVDGRSRLAVFPVISDQGRKRWKPIASTASAALMGSYCDRARTPGLGRRRS